jgi:hypothetical protein
LIARMPMIRMIALSDSEDRPRGAALLVACVLVDAVAAGLLVLGTPLPPLLEGFAAAIAHGAAVLLLSGLAPAQPSRRWLCVAAVLAVPFVGAAVATASFMTRGRGSFALERRRKARRRPVLSTSAIRRLRGALSPCEALLCGDEERRRAALSGLSRRTDPEAIALLRRGAASEDPDLALSAALVLDDIGERAERAERRVDLLDPAELRHGVG